MGTVFSHWRNSPSLDKGKLSPGKEVPQPCPPLSRALGTPRGRVRGSRGAGTLAHTGMLGCEQSSPGHPSAHISSKLPTLAWSPIAWLPITSPPHHQRGDFPPPCRGPAPLHQVWWAPMGEKTPMPGAGKAATFPISTGKGGEQGEAALLRLADPPPSSCRALSKSACFNLSVCLTGEMDWKTQGRSKQLSPWGKLSAHNSPGLV